MDGPLSGLRILDFSRLVPGPYCTLLLAELGAQIVKVEDVRGGDPLRHLPPFMDGVGVVFTALNRGKQSIALDLKQEEGRKVAHDLAAHFQVVVEGFRPGVAGRLHIDFETLAARNPSLVYCSISGYGQHGERRDLTGHDLTYAAISGLLDALSPSDPRVPGVQLVDAAAAFLAAIRILAALQSTDVGPQYLDVSLAQGARALMPLVVAETTSSSATGPSLVQQLRGSERNNLYRCADGRWLALTPLEESFWRQLLAALHSAGVIAEDESPTSERLEAIFVQRPCREWFSLLSGAGVPCAPFQSVGEALHGLESDMGFAASHTRTHASAPALGADTKEFLREAGYTEERIARLAVQEVILPATMAAP